METKFVVLQIFMEKTENLGFPAHVVHTVSPMGNNPAPTFDTYEEAENWIRENGHNVHYYQIQKFLSPIK